MTQAMNNSEALRGLRDIHLPDPVPVWPPAPGWWLLAASLVMLLIAAAWLWKRYRRGAYRRVALKELQELRQALTQGRSRTAVLGEVSVLLRRAAITRYGRAQVAALHGAAWLEFLDRTGRAARFNTHGQALLDAPYRRTTDAPIEPLLSLAQQWLEAQR